MESITSFHEKMKEVEQSLSKEYGPFALFALLEREAAPGRWDVIVSAPWLGTGREDILKIAEQITRHLSPDQAIQVARIVPLPPESDFVRFLQDAYREMSATGRQVRLGPSVLSGIETRSGYILADGATLARAEPLDLEAVAA